MAKIKITLAQIPKQKNLSEIKKVIQMKKNSDLIIFPEETLFTSDLKIINTIQNFVKKNNTHIVVGIIYKKNNKLYNYAYYISPEKVDRYQKIHIHWTEKCVPGNKFKVIKTHFGKIGLLVCFDASFQESGRVIALMGAELIVVINAIPLHFPYKYSLLRSCSIALSNQVFVIDCNKPGEKFTGHSAIFDPYGNKLIELNKHKSIVTKTIDLNVVKEWRKKEKIFPCRKPKLYKIITSNNSSD